MKQFGKIFKFELKNHLSNKVFAGITIFFAALIIVVMFGMRFVAEIESSDDSPDTADKSIMIISTDDKSDAEAIRTAFSAAFEYDYDVVLSTDSADKIKASIQNGEAECAFIIDGLTSYTYYVENLSLYDANTAIADEVLKSLYQQSAMINAGLSPEEAQAVMSVVIEHDTEMLGVDQFHNFFYTYIMIFALYMVILLYGQMVATNVASEKSSRAMELLVTSADPTSMMFGKVIASCIAGLIQLVAIFGTAFVCYNINKEYIGGNEIISSIFDIPADLLVYMLVFFMLGFFMYAFMYGAVGSTASKLEDVSTAVMPITLIFIATFMIVMFSMSSGNVDNGVMLFCSFFPLTSPMAMFTRIAMSHVPPYQIIISIVVLAGSVVGIGYAAAKIYRVGVLLYGNKVRIKDIFKMLRAA